MLLASHDQGVTGQMPKDYKDTSQMQNANTTNSESKFDLSITKCLLSAVPDDHHQDFFYKKVMLLAIKLQSKHNILFCHVLKHENQIFVKEYFD